MSVVKKQKGASRSKQPAASKVSRQAESDGDCPIKIPDKPNVPPENLTDYTMILFGEKGIGKTSLAAEFPNSLVFMWEPRRRNLRIKQIPQEGETPLNWERFKKYIRKILSTKGDRTVVVDTVDRAYVACRDFVCHNKGMKYPSDTDFGATWSECKQEWETVMNALLYAEKTVVFVSHAKVWTVNARTSEGFDQVIPTCSDACWNYLKATCDLAVYYGYTGRERTLTVRGDDLVWSACGMSDRFLGPSGEPLTTFHAGTSSAEAFKNLCRAYNNEIENLKEEE